MEMKKNKQWVRLVHPRSSRKATGGFEKKHKIFVQGRNWNGYCQFPALEHDLVCRS